MRLLSISLTISLVILCTALPLAVAAQEAQSDSGEIEEEEEEEEKDRDPKFVFGFDVGAEVLFTMIRLREGIPPETVYETEVDSIFGTFGGHPSVETVGDFLDQGVRYEVMFNTLLCHGPPPDFRKEYSYWTPDSSLAGTSAHDRARLLSAVRSFYNDAGFQEFWDVRWEGAEGDTGAGGIGDTLQTAEGEQGPEGEGPEPESRSIGDTVQTAEGETESDTTEPVMLGADTTGVDTLGVEEAKGLEALEDSLYARLHYEAAREPHRMYYGSRGNAVYRIIPTWQSPVDTALVTRSAGREILAWVLPLAPDSSDVLDRPRWEHSMAVELGSAVAVPLGEWLAPYLAEYEFLFEYLMRGRGRLGLWTSWGECFSDHLRRAVEGRVMLASQGEGAARLHVNSLCRKGFGLLPFFYERLSEYETHRDHYLSIPDFCPRLISCLGDLRPKVFSKEASFGVRVKPRGSRVVVEEVFPDLAAHRAGVEVGDIILVADGVPVGRETDFEALVRERGIGGRIEVVVLRQGWRKELVLLLGADIINYRFVDVGERGGSSSRSDSQPEQDPR